MTEVNRIFIRNLAEDFIKFTKKYEEQLDPQIFCVTMLFMTIDHMFKCAPTQKDAVYLAQSVFLDAYMKHLDEDIRLD